jgi:CheY-like chemotaxis protein/anti-sigma regulatory factor (Ser/Thr protein kinase)
MNRRILIVDDRPEQLNLLKDLLISGCATGNSIIEQIRSRFNMRRQPADPSAISYEIDSAQQGQEGFARVQEAKEAKNPYALVFLDMHMPPGPNGLQTLQRIRSLDKDVEVVLMSGHEVEEERSALAQSIGSDDKLIYLRKPFNIEEVRQVALALTEKWNTTRREKARQRLTNQLMRECGTLTRGARGGFADSATAVLNAFVSFLDANSGIVGQYSEGQVTVVAGTSPEHSKKLAEKISRSTLDAHLPKVSDDSGHGYFPIDFDEFSCFVYIEGKAIRFVFAELQPFLDIMTETARGVLANAVLADRESATRELVATGTAISTITERMDETMEGVRACTRELRQTLDPAQRERLCQAIDEAIDHVSAIGSSIRAYCESRAPIEPHDLSVPVLLAEVRDEISARGSACGIECLVEAAEDVHVEGDRELLKTALLRLVDNAIDAVEASDGPRVVELIGRFSANHRSAEIIVRDHGSGIAPDVAARVFDPYVSSKHRIGLGTTIARQAIEQHGGSIALQPDQGHGAEFLITLPVARPPK